MSDPHKVKVLLEWCANNSIFIDTRIRIGAEDAEEGLGVFSADGIIPPRVTLVKICKQSLLSVRTSSIAELVEYHPYGFDAQLSLALALYVEVLKGRHSKWYGYLQSFPNGIVDIPVFWGLHVDGSEALAWLEGTEASKILLKKTENGFTTLDAVTRFYHGLVEPFLLGNVEMWRHDSNAATTTPGLLGFYRAFSLVSSRAFMVDAFHGLSMVPVADVFNHVIENHVHLESDYDVCPECGSMRECPHDREEEAASEASPSKAALTPDIDLDQFLEMVSNAGIPPRTEIFNTYGESLTNAQLLIRYGFVLDVNHNDRLEWTWHEVVRILLPDGGTELGFETLNAETHALLTHLSGDVFSHSQLIYCEQSTENFFCLNDEGSMSHRLWVLLFVLCIRCGLSLSPDLDVAIEVSDVLALQAWLENVNDVDDDEEDRMLQVDEIPEHDPLALKILLWICTLTEKLCSARRCSTAKNKLGAHESLSDVMEDIPPERVLTHLAISLLMAEMSILDCCGSAWAALRSTATRLFNVEG